MAVVKINALSVPAERGEMLVERFAARLGELSSTDGFLGFELLRPTGENETRWFVYTRWASEEAFQAWRTSPQFAAGHAGPGGGAGGQPGGHPGGAGGHSGPQGGPVSQGAELLEFEVAVEAGPA